MKFKVEFWHAVGEKVIIKALNLEGCVHSVRTDGLDPTYWVVWWSDGSRHDAWLYGNEIEEAQ